MSNFLAKLISSTQSFKFLMEILIPKWELYEQQVKVSFLLSSRAVFFGGLDELPFTSYMICTKHFPSRGGRNSGVSGAIAPPTVASFVLMYP